MDEADKEYFTLKDVASRCGTSYGIVKRDIDKGVLPAYRVGRKYFIAKDEMSEYVAKAAEKWGISTRRVRLLCANGEIDGVI
ncbi:MAG: excisionase family DNA-binding protein, partial [Bacillota bacterium]|nr:excisionase family DNA-binding protein [Bacillota bacterium]